MRWNPLLIGVLLAAGCGGTSMMRLQDKVFDLVPKEDRATLDSSRQAIDEVKKKQDGVRDALSAVKDQKKASAEARELEELSASTAKAKDEWMSAKQAWLAKSETAADKEVEAAEALHQLERARLAESKGLKPYEGFSVAKFQNQQLDYQKAYLNAQIDADKAKSASDEAEKKYRNLEEKLDKARK
jgi:hypothetical protein